MATAVRQSRFVDTAVNAYPINSQNSGQTLSSPRKLFPLAPVATLSAVSVLYNIFVIVCNSGVNNTGGTIPR